MHVSQRRCGRSKKSRDECELIHSDDVGRACVTKEVPAIVSGERFAISKC